MLGMAAFGSVWGVCRPGHSWYAFESQMLIDGADITVTSFSRSLGDGVADSYAITLFNRVLAVDSNAVLGGKVFGAQRGCSVSLITAMNKIHPISLPLILVGSDQIGGETEGCMFAIRNRSVNCRGHLFPFPDTRPRLLRNCCCTLPCFHLDAILLVLSGLPRPCIQASWHRLARYCNHPFASRKTLQTQLASKYPDSQPQEFAGHDQ